MTDKTPRTDAIRGMGLPRSVVNSHEALERELADCRAELERKTKELDLARTDIALANMNIDRLASHAEHKGEHMKVIDEMVNRFLSWPLPESVCADLIATKQGLGRIGTNLLTANEAKQMLEHVLAAPSPAGPNALAEELETAWEESGFELQNDPLSRQLDAAITRALAALRSRPAQGDSRDAVIEECAKVADAYKDSKVLVLYERGPNDPPGNAYIPLTGAHIATAIRSLKSDAAMSQQEKRDG